MDKNRKILTLIFTFIGLIFAGKLCLIYWDANFNPYALPSFCSVNNLIDCDGVAKTTFSQFLGIPLALWGVFFYLFIFIMFTAKKLATYKLFKFMEVFKNPRAYICVLAIIAFCISMGLAFISIFEIHKICVLCFATYCIDLIIAIIEKDYSKPWYYEVQQSFIDFKEALKIKKYIISFIVVIITGISILTYTSLSYVLTPQIKPFKIKYSSNNNFITKDNVMGDKNAKIIIHEYMDYNCSSCYMTNISLRRIMSELDGIMVIQHNFPLDAECHPAVTKGHIGSCRMARYALAAKKQGKYWEANEILFEKTPDNEQKIVNLLRQIDGLNINQLQLDANSPEIREELKMEIEKSLQQEIAATPTIIINMQKITGNMPFYELREKLVSMGATEKKSK